MPTVKRENGFIRKDGSEVAGSGRHWGSNQQSRLLRWKAHSYSDIYLQESYGARYVSRILRDYGRSFGGTACTHTCQCPITRWTLFVLSSPTHPRLRSGVRVIRLAGANMRLHVAAACRRVSLIELQTRTRKTAALPCPDVAKL